MIVVSVNDRAIGIKEADDVDVRHQIGFEIFENHVEAPVSFDLDLLRRGFESRRPLLRLLGQVLPRALELRHCGHLQHRDKDPRNQDCPEH